MTCEECKHEIDDDHHHRVGRPQGEALHYHVNGCTAAMRAYKRTPETSIRHVYGSRRNPRR